MRALGVDFGSKLIGLAIGESDQQVTTARAPLRASGTLAKDARAIADLARQEEADAVVLGVPINLPDRSNRMEKICNQLADRLREEGLDVRVVDEALTSAESEARLASVYKRSAQKQLVHGEAARIILERFFKQFSSQP